MIDVVEEIKSSGYVRVVSNTGIWKFIADDPNDSNFVFLEALDTGLRSRFPIYVDRQQRIFALSSDDKARAGLDADNLVYADVVSPKIVKGKKGKKSK